MDNKIMIDDELDDLSDGQKLVITLRAARSIGLHAQYVGDVLELDEDALDPENVEFLKAWEEQACLYVASLMTARMVADGLLYEDGVDAEGFYVYKAVPGAVAE
jgi:hypothetical protein